MIYLRAVNALVRLCLCEGLSEHLPLHMQHFTAMQTILIFAKSYQFSRPISALRFSDVKILANNDFKMVPDEIKEVTSTCTPIWRN